MHPQVKAISVPVIPREVKEFLPKHDVLQYVEVISREGEGKQLLHPESNDNINVFSGPGVI